MFQKFDFQKFIVVVLVAGSMLHPFAAALGLLIVFAHHAADKYLTKNISDPDRQMIQGLKSDVKALSSDVKLMADKMMAVQQKENLTKAFGSFGPRL